MNALRGKDLLCAGDGRSGSDGCQPPPRQRTKHGINDKIVDIEPHAVFLAETLNLPPSSNSVVGLEGRGLVGKIGPVRPNCRPLKAIPRRVGIPCRSNLDCCLELVELLRDEAGSYLASFFHAIRRL